MAYRIAKLAPVDVKRITSPQSQSLNPSTTRIDSKPIQQLWRVSCYPLTSKRVERLCVALERVGRPCTLDQALNYCCELAERELSGELMSMGFGASTFAD